MCKFFSIIIPVYNIAAYVERCIRSLEAQDFRNWEAICVDDGSQDESRNVLYQCAQHDSRIRVFEQRNSGVVAARVRGFEESTGKFILFLDGDDTLESSALSKLYTVLSETVVDIVQFGFRYVGGRGEVQIPGLLGRYHKDEIVRRIQSSPLEVLGMCIWNKCYSRRVVDLAFSIIGSVRIAHSEDGLFALAAFWHSNEFIFIDKVLYNYYIRESSASHKFNRRIVYFKDVFVREAVDLARHVGKQESSQLYKEFCYHANNATGYIFRVALNDAISWRNAYLLITELRKSDMFTQLTNNRPGRMHSLRDCLIRHPTLFVLCRRFVKWCLSHRF